MAQHIVAKLLLLAACLGAARGQSETCQDPSAEDCAARGDAMLQSSRGMKEHMNMMEEDEEEVGEASEQDLIELDERMSAERPEEYLQKMERPENMSIVQVLTDEDEHEMEVRAEEVRQINEDLARAHRDTPPAVAHWNEYGWDMSFKSGENGLHATEILHLTPHKGSLFAATGHWMEPNWKPSEVWRTDCTVCQWTKETVVSSMALRTEVLKSITWTTDATGKKLPAPVEKLYAGFYVNYKGWGRNSLVMRTDETRSWTEGIYWFNRWKENHFSARAVALHQDSVTKIDMIFANTGMDGITTGKFEPSSKTFTEWSRKSETGPVTARPLGIVIMGGRIFFSAADKVWRRNDGTDPSWTLVINMNSKVNEAVGGVRGLTAAGNTLMFAWCPDGGSKGAMVRAEPSGDEFTLKTETTVKEELQKYLADLKKKSTHKTFIAFVLAAYNNFLEVPQPDGSKVMIVGFEAILFWDTYKDNPVDPGQTKYDNRNRPYSYYSGSGYLIRRGPGNYEVRTPYGPRYSHAKHEPDLVATRCYANSPFHDGTVFMGGYDCNHFAAEDTAWIVHGVPEAVSSKPVPCFTKNGCMEKNDAPMHFQFPTPPVVATTTTTTTTTTTSSKKSCDICPNMVTAYGKVAVAHLTCQHILRIINHPGSRYPCAAATARFGKACCRPKVTPNPSYKGGPFPCPRFAASMPVGTNSGIFFRCRAGYCILATGQCNAVKQCGDGSDEEGCP